jgi:hypothetical protein
MSVGTTISVGVTITGTLPTRETPSTGLPIEPASLVVIIILVIVGGYLIYSYLYPIYSKRRSKHV